MTPDQLRMARHALGLPNERKTSYRNRYYAPLNSEASRQWDDLVSRGLAERGTDRATQVMFGLTLAGAKRAIDPTERLDPEDFPASPSQEADRG